MPPEGSNSRPVTSIKALLLFLCLTVQKLTTLDANGDGKVNLFELLGLMTSLGPKVPALYQAIPNLLPELRDITEDEMDEVRDYFIAHFDIPSDRAEAVVEKCIEILQDNFVHYQELRDLLD